MKLFTAFIIMCCSLFLTCDGQVIFQKMYGGSTTKIGAPHMAQQTVDGGLIMAGRMEGTGAGAIDFYLASTSANGNLLWAKTYGNSANDRIFSVLQTSDGGFAAAGWTNSFSGPDSAFFIYLIRTDGNGNLLWSKKIGDIDWYHVIDFRQTSDGGFILCGYIGIGFNDYLYLVKTDGSGNVSWTKAYTGNSEMGWSIQQTTDGGFIIAGLISAADGNIYIVKTDSSGTILWTKSIGGPGWEEGYSVFQTQDGGYMICGYTDSFGAGGSDVYLIKLDGSGNLLWSNAYGGAGDEYGNDVRQTSDGGFIIAGNSNSFGAGDDDVYVIKTDSAGNVTWSKVFGTTDNEEGYSVQETSDGGFIVTGQSSNTNLWNIFVVKTDINGFSGCNESSVSTIVTPVVSTVSLPPVPAVSSYGIGSTAPTSVSSGGTESIVCILTASDEKAPVENLISFFPNPASTELKIKNSELKIQEIEIYDMLGEKIFSHQPLAQREISIDISRWNSGIYFVSVKDKNKVQTQKLVIQR